MILPWDLPWADYEYILSHTHGILFPGGDVDIIHHNDFNDRMKKTLSFVKARNDKGNYYFAIGICMGFEILLEQTAGTSSILDSGYKHFTTGGVEIVDHVALQKSDFFGKGRARALLKKWLGRSDGLLYAHNDGVSVQHFNTHLSDKHYLIATGSSNGGKKFVAMTSSKKYPIFTTQFHPEKNQFEKRRGKYNKLNRKPQVVEVLEGWMINIVRTSRAKRNYEFDFLTLPAQVKNYHSWNFISYPWNTDLFEQGVLLGKMSACGRETPCHEYVISDEMENQMIAVYQHVKKTTSMFFVSKKY